MTDPRLVVQESLTEREKEVIFKHWKNTPLAERSSTNHFDFVREGKPTLFVKYGGHDLLDEGSTQTFFHSLAQSDSSAPHIPAVYSAFRLEGRHFLVMEKVDMPTLESCGIAENDAIQRAASAVGWLLNQMHSIPSDMFGRISFRSTPVWHQFFKDHQAPVPFISSEALEKYINKALSRRPGGRQAPPPAISLSNELAIYHSDISDHNFLYDVATGRVCIVDFQHIGVLPKPFQTFAFFNIGCPFAAAVGDHLRYQPSDVADAMAPASALLKMTAGAADLGLNALGERTQSNSVSVLITSNSPNRCWA